MNNHNINVEIDRDLEKSFFIDRTERDIIIGEEAEFDTITPEQMLTWAIDTNNIPLRSRDGAIIRVEGGGTSLWGPTYEVEPLYSQIFWVIDNGNGTVSVTELANYDHITNGFNDITTALQAYHSSPKHDVNLVDSGSAATYVSFGMNTVVTDPSTTTTITLDVLYSGMTGRDLIIQNHKGSGNLTITLGANTLLGGMSPVIAAGSTLHLMAVATNSGPTNYKF